MVMTGFLSPHQGYEKKDAHLGTPVHTDFGQAANRRAILPGGRWRRGQCLGEDPAAATTSDNDGLSVPVGVSC